MRPSNEAIASIHALTAAGVSLLKHAILRVLCYAATETPYGIGSAEIGKRAGITNGKGPGTAMNEAIVNGILAQLYDEKKVVYCRQVNMRGGWKLSTVEFETQLKVKDSDISEIQNLNRNLSTLI